jgi:hypothetical protein
VGDVLEMNSIYKIEIVLEIHVSSVAHAMHCVGYRRNKDLQYKLNSDLHHAISS